MFCKNCGKELEEQFKFCPSCGTATGEGLNANTKRVQSGGTVYFDTETVFYYLSMVCGVGIIFLVFSKWFRIDSWIIRSNLSVWGTIKAIYELYQHQIEVSFYENYEMFSENYGMFIVVIILLIILALLIIGLSAYYVWKAYKTGARAKDNEHMIYGYPAMLTIAIACGVFAIVLKMIMSSDKYSVLNIQFNDNFYYIITLACINRFVIMPVLNRCIYYRNKKDKGEEL